jgi:hypothetical protein
MPIAASVISAAVIMPTPTPMVNLRLALFLSLSLILMFTGPSFRSQLASAPPTSQPSRTTPVAAGGPAPAASTQPTLPLLTKRLGSDTRPIRLRPRPPLILPLGTIPPRRVHHQISLSRAAYLTDGVSAHASITRLLYIRRVIGIE